MDRHNDVLTNDIIIVSPVETDPCVHHCRNLVVTMFAVAKYYTGVPGQEISDQRVDVSLEPGECEYRVVFSCCNGAAIVLQWCCNSVLKVLNSVLNVLNSV